MESLDLVALTARSQNSPGATEIASNLDRGSNRLSVSL
jgi:hypothetical protein